MFPKFFKSEKKVFQRCLNSEKKKSVSTVRKRCLHSGFTVTKKVFHPLKKRYFLGAFTMKRRCLTCLSMEVFPPLKQKLSPNG